MHMDSFTPSSLPDERGRSLLGLDEAVTLQSVLVDQRDRRRQVGLLGLDVAEAELEQACRSGEEDRKPDQEAVEIRGFGVYVIRRGLGECQIGMKEDSSGNNGGCSAGVQRCHHRRAVRRPDGWSGAIASAAGRQRVRRADDRKAEKQSTCPAGRHLGWGWLMAVF